MPRSARSAWVERNPIWAAGSRWYGCGLLFTRDSFPAPVCGPMPMAEAFRVAWHVNRKQWFHGVVQLARGAPILLSIPEEPPSEGEMLTLECCDARDGCAPGSLECPCVPAPILTDQLPLD